MKLKKTILIEIEIADREIESKLLLSFNIAKHGYRIFLGSRDSLSELIYKNVFSECIYICKSLSKNLEKKYELN